MRIEMVTGKVLPPDDIERDLIKDNSPVPSRKIRELGWFGRVAKVTLPDGSVGTLIYVFNLPPEQVVKQ